MSWVDVTRIRKNYRGPGVRITAGINIATGGVPRLSFNFNKASCSILNLSAGRVDMEVGENEDEGFVRIFFDRLNGGLRLIHSSGHQASGLRLSTSLWNGLNGKDHTRTPVQQAYWDPDKRLLVMAIPDILTGKQTRHRNDLGAELGLR